mmetsp:Transcript_9057/g.22856  ORF Transcript_9057/g.22856 Transcript_9057/m.22856 type:complete len:239 (-) Transcript_9057:411-1127(-)
MPRNHKFTALCPNRHELTLWTARAGKCDGCHRFVADGEQVMDCRACNWYLCGECRPSTSEQVESMWGAVSNLFFGDVCRAPLPHELEVAEVVIGPPAGSARAHSDDEPSVRPVPATQQQAQQQHHQQQEAIFSGTVGEKSLHGQAPLGASPTPTPAPPVAVEAVPAEKKVEQEPVAAMPPPPPLAREMTDLIDLSVEPTAADPFDLSTVDFTATEAPKKAPLDGGALHGVAAALAGGA